MHSIKELLTTNSPRHLKLRVFTECVALQPFWDLFPGSIRHLTLFGMFLGPPLPILKCAAPIRLHSLRLWLGLEGERQDIYSWALHPFDLSHLRALSIHDCTGFPWDNLSLQRIEILDLDDKCEQPIDLSSFPNLSTLRITVERRSTLSMTVPTLSTIAQWHRIQTIVLSLKCALDGLQRIECEELDSLLSTLHMRHPPIIEFELNSHNPIESGISMYFPQLTSRDLLRFVGPHLVSAAIDMWWEVWLA
ncbi:hypothetical protein DFH06DRAFT_356453 [Mycena polygramma]|nr:hypothetical protein DFH06DRAFT_356453 [Mycena polygramma]